MRLVVLLLAVATMLAGCASTVRGGTLGGPETITDQVRTPPPPDQIVFQVDVGGGYWQQEYAPTARPELSVYGDGRAFVIADRGTRSPGTPVEFRQAAIVRGDLLNLITRVRSIGLFDSRERELGEPQVTDMPSTAVSFRPDGAPARTVSAYALQYDEGDDDLTPDDRNGRRALRRVIEAFHDALVEKRATTWTPDRVDVTELKLYTRTSFPQLPWPGPALADLLEPTRHGPCAVLDGALAARVYSSAVKTGNLHWREGTIVRPLAIRALLPGEVGCRS